LSSDTRRRLRWRFSWPIVDSRGALKLKDEAKWRGPPSACEAGSRLFSSPAAASHCYRQPSFEFDLVCGMAGQHRTLRKIAYRLALLVRRRAGQTRRTVWRVRIASGFFGITANQHTARQFYFAGFACEFSFPGSNEKLARRNSGFAGTID